EKKDVPLSTFKDVTRLLTDDRGNLAPVKGKMHRVLTGSPIRFAKDSMVWAFTKKSYIGNDEWRIAFPKLPPDRQKSLLIERENERLALLAWLEAGAPKEAYDENEFEVPAGKLKGTISKDMLIG